MSQIALQSPEPSPEGEVWKSIPSTGGVYEASSLGRIRRVVGGRGTRAGKILAATLRDDGYCKVSVSVGNKKDTPLVHALVAEAFLGPRLDDASVLVNHKNGNRADNRAANLEYSTYSKNNAHAYRVLKRPSVHGEQNGHARLTDAIVRELRRRATAGESLGALAREFGVSRPTVSIAVSGKTWAHLNDDAPPVTADDFDQPRQLHGEAHGQARLSADDVAAMRRRAAAGESVGSLAKEYGLAAGYALRVIRGESWTHLNDVAPPTEGLRIDAACRSVGALPEWMPVPQVFGYEVSKAGVVRRSAPGQGAQPGEVLAAFDDGRGYLETGLSAGGVAKTHKIHLLVAAAFLGPCPPGYQCNHKNGDKHDPRIENLEYVTPRANAEHALHVLKRKVARGEDRSKLTDDKIREIRRRVAAGESRAAMGRAFGISAEQAGRIVARTSWAHVK
jgi:hypothetical protein